MIVEIAQLFLVSSNESLANQHIARLLHLAIIPTLDNFKSEKYVKVSVKSVVSIIETVYNKKGSTVFVPVLRSLFLQPQFKKSDETHYQDAKAALNQLGIQGFLSNIFAELSNLNYVNLAIVFFNILIDDLNTSTMENVSEYDGETCIISSYLNNPRVNVYQFVSTLFQFYLSQKSHKLANVTYNLLESLYIWNIVKRDMLLDAMFALFSTHNPPSFHSVVVSVCLQHIQPLTMTRT